MYYKEKYVHWLTDPFFDEITHKELSTLTDEKKSKTDSIEIWSLVRVAYVGLWERAPIE